MATCEEAKIGTRKGTGTTSERSYIIKAAPTLADATAALLATLPNIQDGMTLNVQDCEYEELADGIWLAVGKWASSTNTFQPASSFHISFEISGQQTHITQSRATVNKYSANNAWIRDFKGAIGVNEDGTIEGCDVVVPALTLKINYTFDQAAISDSYIQTLMNVCGSVNTDSFHEFAAGTLLMTAVSGSQRDDGKWDVSFAFAASPNDTGLSVGAITGIAKKGWEYLWVYYATDVQTVDDVKVVHKVPKAVYIEEVYRKTSFSSLGI